MPQVVLIKFREINPLMTKPLMVQNIAK